MTGPKPLIDIVMLVHDQAGWADLAIRAVEHHTRNAYRLIIVDSASVELETKMMLEAAERRGHTIVRLPENKSFSNGVNAGIAAGDAKFVCILNDDAIVTEGWEGALIQDLTNKQIGMTGARSNYVSGPQGMGGAWPESKEPPYLVFVCVAMRRELYNVVGPLDEETFDGFSTEDIDYSWRVKAAGHKLKVSNAFVLHAGSRTITAKVGSDPDAYNRMNAKYNARLVEKWGKQHCAENVKIQSKGLVVSYHAEEWTRVTFMESLMGLRRSDGVGFSYLHVRRAPIQMARQLAADYALDNGFDWFVQFDDDAVFPSDVLSKLLSHDKDFVAAVAYQRKPPHLPCCYEIGEGGLLGAPMEGIEHTGLRRVDVTGMHCSIMKTSVIRRLREGTKKPDGSVDVPGIRQYFGGFDNKVGEDFAFCLNLKKIGIPVYVDSDFIAGHIGSEIIVDEHYKQEFMAGRR